MTEANGAQQHGGEYFRITGPLLDGQGKRIRENISNLRDSRESGMLLKLLRAFCSHSKPGYLNDVDWVLSYKFQI